MSILNNLSLSNLIIFLRFLKKIPSLWHQELAKSRHSRFNWAPNRVIVKGSNDYYEIYSPEPKSKYGSTIRTYNIFVHQASAWWMRNEVENFIKYAKKFNKFADIGSAEGFYSALFASIKKSNAEILSVDCGSSFGCNPMHSILLKKQNSDIFKPKRWDFSKSFVTSNSLEKPDLELPEDCKITTLTQLFNEEDFHPELIKFDIESSEYEVLLDSLDYLFEKKPTLIIEVHNEMFKRRKLNFGFVLEKLFNLGYKIVAYDYKNYLEIWNSHIVLEFNK